MKNEEKDHIAIPDDFVMDYSLPKDEVRDRLLEREKEIDEAMEKLEK